jgi:hypothetical protein
MYLRARTQSSSLALDYKPNDVTMTTMTVIFADLCGSKTTNLERSSSSSSVCIPTSTTFASDLLIF